MTTAAQNSKQILTQKGTAATPSFSFLGGNATGMYLAGTNQLGFSTAGVNAVTIDASQNVTITNALTIGSLVTPTVVGGTTASSSLTLKSTSGVGTTDSILFKVGNNGATTAMTVDTSGNVGIGTSSPTYKLQVLAGYPGVGVYRDVDVTSSGPAGQGIEIGARNGSTPTPGASIVGGLDNPATTGSLQLLTRTANSLTEKMRIDSSGNVGIGTSSPTSFGGTNLNIKAPSSSTYGSILLESGTYVWEVLVNQTSGVMAMGSRSNHALTFAVNDTERMRIDTSGNVGIGTSSPADKLVVDGYAAAKSGLKLARGDNAYLNVAKFWDGTLTPNTGPRGFLLAIGNDSGNPLVFFTNDVERARIDSSGNVGIGTSSPAYKLEVTGTNGIIGATGSAGYGAFTATGSGTNSSYIFFRNATNGEQARITSQNGGTLIFGNGNSATDRMVIDSSGNLLVGTTSGTGNGERIYAVTSTFVPFAGRHSSTTAGKFWFFGPNSGNNYVVQNQSSVGVYVTDGGTSWTGTSDERLKNITGTIQNGLVKVASLRAAEFTWKADDTNKPQVGLIAQDVQKVLPEVVDVDTEGNLGVRYSEVISLLVAALQELSAKNDALEARLAALEGK